MRIDARKAGSPSEATSERWKDSPPPPGPRTPAQPAATRAITRQRGASECEERRSAARGSGPAPRCGSQLVAIVPEPRVEELLEQPARHLAATVADEGARRAHLRRLRAQ